MNRPPPTTLAALPPPGQHARIAALRAYGILDTPEEGAFDDITRIASLVCHTPIAVVNLIDEHRQWFKSEIGLGVRETPLETSLCAHAILEADFMEVPDTTLDARFQCNPLVTGAPYLRFYAGALLKTSAGHALGTVCVLDTQPRQLSDEQRSVLRALARQAMAQLELRRALLHAERGRRYRSRLMAVAGHDLMQPLTVLTTVIHGLRAQMADAGDSEQFGLASAAAQQLGTSLSRLAQASRQDADQDPAELAALPLDEVLNAVRDTWSYIAQRKGLQFAVAPCALRVDSDAGMLRTVLDNLVGNAVKYTPHGAIRIDCIPADSHVRIEVTDTGIGIADHLLTRIFDEFRQADPSSDGLGLGLSIAKRTADLLGCGLTVASQPGAGSTFAVIVPRSATTLASAA
ncbi:GAF domain-containing sensor histidine kinase [Lysobacter koreensis]|uniref:histidine kinase n=1 Tax=Lysobacter koreensis TaxID=266122 RepID=A0ABW2YQH9_9GAMM